MTVSASPVVVVVAGGVAPATLPHLPDDVWVIAADSGVDRARALGLRVDEAVGDFDSVSDDGLAWARSSGARIHRHPAEKDETDLELALEAAVERRPAHVHVAAVDGGRPDHFLANLLLVSSPLYAHVPMTVHLADSTVHIVHANVELRGEPNQLVSLLPVHGTAVGVRTEGLRYPLRGETLPAGTPRGMSNELTGERGRVAVEAGVLLVAVARSGQPVAARP